MSDLEQIALAAIRHRDSRSSHHTLTQQDRQWLLRYIDRAEPESQQRGAIANAGGLDVERLLRMIRNELNTAHYRIGEKGNEPAYRDGWRDALRAFRDELDQLLAAPQPSVPPADPPASAWCESCGFAHEIGWLDCIEARPPAESREAEALRLLKEIVDDCRWSTTGRATVPPSGKVLAEARSFLQASSDTARPKASEGSADGE